MRIDPHSFTDDSQSVIQELNWEANLDFESRIIHATATLSFLKPGSGPLDLDTRDLKIHRVEDLEGNALKHEVGPVEPILGQRLRIELPANTAAVRIKY